MKTYLLLFFNSEGGKPSDVTDRLMGLGFKPTAGNYDYVYTWLKGADLDDILTIGDKVALTLKGLHVYFRLETV